MTYVVEHEAKRTASGDFLPCGVGDTQLTDPDGNPHRSRGIVQINSYYHSEVSDQEAFNVDFSLDFLGKALKEGKGHEWTTYRAYKEKLLALKG